MPSQERLKLVAYGRVSTVAQLDGYGPEIQTAAMRAWAKSEGHTITAEMFDRGVSGTVDADERPELSRALNLIVTGKVAGIVVPNMDRLARELTVQEAALMLIWANDGRVFTVEQGEIMPDDESDPYRRFVRQVMGAASELERNLIVKRLQAGIATKKAAGGYSGGAPAYGQRAVGNELQPDAAEAPIVARIKAMRAEGLSLRTIAAQLNAEGVPTKRGSAWLPNTVNRIVNPATREADAQRGRDLYAAKKAEKRVRKANKILSRHIPEA